MALDHRWSGCGAGRATFTSPSARRRSRSRRGRLTGRRRVGNGQRASAPSARARDDGQHVQEPPAEADRRRRGGVERWPQALRPRGSPTSSGWWRAGRTATIGTDMIVERHQHERALTARDEAGDCAEQAHRHQGVEEPDREHRRCRGRRPRRRSARCRTPAGSHGSSCRASSQCPPPACRGTRVLASRAAPLVAFRRVARPRDRPSRAALAPWSSLSVLAEVGRALGAPDARLVVVVVR